MKPPLLAPSLLAAALAAGAISSARAQGPPVVELHPGGPACVAGEILVQFKAGVTEVQTAEAFRRGGLALKKHIHTPAMQDVGRIGLTHAATNLPVQAAINAVSRLPGVEFAEPNWIVSRQAEANDPFYLDGSLWGMLSDDNPFAIGPAATTNMFGSQAEKAWAAGFTGSRDVFIGIVDTSGIQYDHPDLAANIWTNPGEIADNGLDDDGNGYVDDLHGWNAFGDNGTVHDIADGHGTHVAGTIGAAGGNGIGVAGVNWNVSMVSGKFGQNGSGSYADAIQAIDYLTALKTRKGLNIVALNNSWSGAGFSQALLDAVTRAAGANILVVAAASNNSSNNDLTPVYPANYDTTPGAGYDAVISVAGINSIGDKRLTSDWGATSVDLGAPGEEVLSTVPTGAYALKNGTSMATPHVSGAIALYATTHPGATAAQSRYDLLTTGAPTLSLSGITATGARLDAAALMSTAPTTLPAPGGPASVHAVVISGAQVDLNWSDQSNDEWGFAIERAAAGQAFVLADTVAWNMTTYSDRTARPGNSYYYRVKAYNPGGGSAYASANGGSAVSTPAVSVPGAPTGLQATALGKGGISLTWTDRSNNENGFQVERQTGTAAWQVLTTLPANTIGFTDASTVKSTAYSYRVRASNAAGFSSFSNLVSVKSR
ncbi:MAG: hypothetical protein EOP86_00845 [Verrucomicrobiaceae bacterium]|nr:MAG: hypothetical protein EOP86_00845 [Verrucomicrobiaceae bacterium]